MRMNEIVFNNATPFDGYGEGFFRLGGQLINGPVLTSVIGTYDWSGLDDVDPLLSLSGKIDVLFIGTGTEIAHIPSDLRIQFENVNLGVEVMNSPAACRTYNVLLSEGRRIAAAVLPV